MFYHFELNTWYIPMYCSTTCCKAA